MTPRRSRVTALILTLISIVAAAPAAAGLDVPSAWDGPWHPLVTPQQTSRFIELWAPRLADRAWMEGFVAQRELTTEIQAEGFHDEDELR